MKAKLFTSPVALLKAAVRKLGGRVVSYDGTPALAIDPPNVEA